MDNVCGSSAVGCLLARCMAFRVYRLGLWAACMLGVLCLYCVDTPFDLELLCVIYNTSTLLSFDLRECDGYPFQGRNKDLNKKRGL